MRRHSKTRPCWSSATSRGSKSTPIGQTRSPTPMRSGSIADTRKLRWLKWAFTDPEQLKPGLTRQTLTEQAAAEFARLAQRLRDCGHPSQAVAHFINRLVFCMFAEDVDLLPGKMFGRMLDHAAVKLRLMFRFRRSGGLPLRSLANVATDPPVFARNVAR